jgi:predicted ribosomally synthesized peptide with nif11-like leader
MEDVKKFYAALAQDANIQERAKMLNSDKPGDEASTAAAIVAFAAKEGYSFTVDDVKAYLTENATTELTDDDLKAVAGGGDSPCFCVVGGGGPGAKCACVLGGGGKDYESCSCILLGW